MKRMPGYVFLISAFLAFHSQASLAQQLQPVFGPEIYTRTTGAPDQYSATFKTAGNAQAEYKMIVENGVNAGERSSSASIILNGLEVVKQNELNQTVNIIEKPVALLPENTFTVSLAGGPESRIRVGIYCVSGCGIGVKILSPVSGAAIDASTAIVKGQIINKPAEVDMFIEVANELETIVSNAEVQGDMFASLVKLGKGPNKITVHASDQSDHSAMDEITVYCLKSDDPLRMTVNPLSGVDPLEVTLSIDGYVPDTTSYKWDVDGDGMTDMAGAEMTSIKQIFEKSGLYFPKAIVTDKTGAGHPVTGLVNVIDRSGLDELLKKKWNEMKECLAKGDLDGAVAYFHPEHREKYRKTFVTLQASIGDIARDMGPIQLIYSIEHIAKYRIRRSQIINGQQQLMTYYIYFMKNPQNSVWQILNF